MSIKDVEQNYNCKKGELCPFSNGDLCSIEPTDLQVYCIDDVDVVVVVVVAIADVADVADVDVRLRIL